MDSASETDPDYRVDVLMGRVDVEKSEERKLEMLWKKKVKNLMVYPLDPEFAKLSR